MKSGSVALAMLAALAAWARAQSSASSSQEARWGQTVELRLDVGIFSAIGFAGVTAGYSPIDPLLVEVGVGWGESGLQLSAMPKVALGSDRNRFIFGCGPSTGLDRGGQTSYWLSLDLGYEYRAPQGFVLYVAGGTTLGLDGRMHHICFFECARDDQTSDSVRGLFGPQFRLGLGTWF
jgi:hypothetical protein